jgi:NADH:ubiquinone oxidoreductase subunit C
VSSWHDAAALASAIREAAPSSAAEAEGLAVRVRAESLRAVAAILRDALGYDTLSMVTAVDHIDQERMDLVYVAQSTAANTLCMLKAWTSERDDPEAPSVVGVWRSADLQEREIYDLFGVRFRGHPDLRRLFLWDEFQGFPLRKDFLPLSQ